MYRLDKSTNTWYYCGCGYVFPNPIEVGKGVWCGSISSRDGWTTSAVARMQDFPRKTGSPYGKRGVLFQTASGSLYFVFNLGGKEGPHGPHGPLPTWAQDVVAGPEKPDNQDS
jgi:hypothetical protein